MMVDKAALKAMVMKWWPVIALLAVFLFSFYIRTVAIVPDRMLSFDPVFQYRYTKYLVDWGTLPAWDELSYYMGRPIVTAQYPPFMWYVTAAIYMIFKGFGASLITVATYSAAFYGAMITIPVFLLGRELSNKYGGLLAAFLVGTAPQILIRTFGSSYDTDQFVIFFIALTLYLGLYAIRKRTPASIFAAIGGFTGFMLAWGGMFSYTFLILVGFVMIKFLVDVFVPEHRTEKAVTKIGLQERAKKSFKETKWQVAVLIVMFLGMTLTGVLVGANPVTSIMSVVGFAQAAERSIVNVSIAELQPFSIFSVSGWLQSIGRFVTNNIVIDSSLLIIFFFLMGFALWHGWKKGKLELAFLLSLIAIGVYSTFRGIRFTEFTSVFFIVVIASGFGYLLEWLQKKGEFFKSIGIGLGIFMVFIGASVGLQTGLQLGPDMDSNWDNAWNFLRTSTPELSLVGTWWDPGHMITGLANRRVVADGAHCTKSCMYTINQRITDLGRILATSNETESVNLIKKYQGTSPEVYWIASNDLIGKFQWLQYFGLGCDARYEASCPVYNQLAQTKYGYGANNTIVVRYYSDILVLSGNVPIPILTQNRYAALFDEVIYNGGNGPVSFKFSDYDVNGLVQQIKPLESQLNVKLQNQTVGQTVWISPDFSYIVIIPPTLRNTIFTKMFFLEGQGLQHFKEVLNNPEVKIYKVV